MLQGPRRRKSRNADQVDHEQRHALKIDDEYFARQGRHREKKRAGEKHLNHDDGKKRLQVPAQVIRANPGVIRPRGQGAEIRPEQQAAEDQYGGDK